MNLNEMILLLLFIMGGMLTITISFYGGKMILHWLEMPDSAQALASFVKPIDSIVSEAQPVSPVATVSLPIVLLHK
jgi:hypothetical protein